MAQVTVEQLIEAIKLHPDYRKWADGVSADESLYVVFTSKSPGGVESDDYYAVNGFTIVIDKVGDGRIYGIEIA